PQQSSDHCDDDNGEETDTKKQPNKWIDIYLQCTESNHKLNDKIIDLESQIHGYQTEIEQLNEQLAKYRNQLKIFQQNLDLIESLKGELIKQQDVITDLKKNFDKVTDMNRELMNEMNSSKHKESELLEYTERLTAKMVSLQCEHNSLEEKIRSLQSESDRYHCDYDRIVHEREELQQQLQSIIDTQSKKIECLDEQIVKKNVDVENQRKRIEELENDINIMKRKHILNLKELNKEIQQLRRNQQQQQPKMLDVPQSSNNNKTSENNSSSLSSRTNSLNSLNNHDSMIIDSRTQLSNDNNESNGSSS
ncbi:hypothetical protein BLA29_008793, partial [Euroglyphus maynei]